jgi:hypothetical protein
VSTASTRRGVVAVGDVELAQQSAHMGLHGALAEEQPLGHAGVGEALGYQPQDVVLAFGQLGEAASCFVASEQLTDHVGIQGRAAHAVTA